MFPDDDLKPPQQYLESLLSHAKLSARRPIELNDRKFPPAPQEIGLGFAQSLDLYYPDREIHYRSNKLAEIRQILFPPSTLTTPRLINPDHFVPIQRGLIGGFFGQALFPTALENGHILITHFGETQPAGILANAKNILEHKLVNSLDSKTSLLLTLPPAHREAYQTDLIYLDPQTSIFRTSPESTSPHNPRNFYTQFFAGLPVPVFPFDNITPGSTDDYFSDPQGLRIA